MKTSERIAHVADRIEAVLDANPSAHANPGAMLALRTAAAELGAHDPYASEKLIQLMERAQVYYGARSFFRLPGTSRHLWSDMRDDLLDRLRMRARVLASQGE
ncbi:hypothetical protein [Piscinibacter sp.]|uniref:hypothetical protein n=1 Tax=Piscinibacter sp. TaxID=1903157 RepID=UPI002BBA0500|nr:hypothetical protein [Albitalea sp.]HUG23064.1 hypothetical protein [Albitalea sp.]